MVHKMSLLTPSDSSDEPLPDWKLGPDALREKFRGLENADFLPLDGIPRGDLVPAAVLIGIVKRPEPTVILTVRARHLSAHPGQIAFPGGRCDQADQSLVSTALREAHEEVGVLSHQVEVLGLLSAYVTGTSYLVTPVVALLHPELNLRPDVEEVADVFEIPLSFVLNPLNYRTHIYTPAQVSPTNTFISERTIFSILYSDTHPPRHIWGATAAMLHQLYLHLRD
jgi:8-oxo-dGTP pyrophosphatase MutT (NUDIX family)